MYDNFIKLSYVRYGVRNDNKKPSCRYDSRPYCRKADYL